jgi:acyl transferase domain-containing protein/NADPH:quinone reductase-like Zn-dependent oxidoreductase/acyl carrier protein
MQGKAYTFAAGVLDDIWGFDTGVFSISPREAEQMDPQQRLLLKVVWEAIEDAQVDPADLAGRPVGVYVGASSMDHGVISGRDNSLSDAYMMTGNTLSLLANRISHAFDLRGPSFVIDTACSSAMVALDRARRDLAQGVISTAIVAGVNLLLNPNSFVGFCAARMLSPTGLCRSFSGQADGYVRSEGCVALVLQSGADAPRGAMARIVESDTNADGYTVNVALPSEEGQFRLLASLYGNSGFEPDALHFLEAHGTGTLVGDPIEAQALGRALGRHRKAPLPIGSVKGNVGHLEPAAGLVGVLKALVAFEDRCLPPSLHAEELNPRIDFEGHNLLLVREAMALPYRDELFAGVSSFGFGGVNSHCILASVDGRLTNTKPMQKGELPERIFVTSAFCDAALRALAGAYAERFAESDSMAPGGLIDEAWSGRGLHPRRLGVLARHPEEAAAALASYAASLPAPRILSVKEGVSDSPLVFAYCGNGAQYAGMSRLALCHDDAYSNAYDRVDALFAERTGWSLRERLFAGTLEADLSDCQVAQPLLMADQVAQTMALAERGLRPAAVIGHSAGEHAAAWAVGALSLENMVELVINRSRAQSQLAGLGTMAALQTDANEAQELIDAYQSVDGYDDKATMSIAAVNSPRSVTLVGPRAQLVQFTSWVKATHRLPCVLLPVNYPYHSPMQDVCEAEMRAQLQGVVLRAPDLPYFSATRGARLECERLGPDYWWHNMRQPVLFEAATQAALADGYRAFLEVGPQPVLTGYLKGTAEGHAGEVAVTHTLSRSDPDDTNPISRAVLRAVLHGAQTEPGTVFHDPSPASWSDLPHYPWQDAPLRITDSPEIARIYRTDPADLHPLLGLRIASTLPVWRLDLDDRVIPRLHDHRVGSASILPATAFAEMIYAAAVSAARTGAVEVFDIDLIAPLVLSAPNGVEIQTSVDIEARTVRVQSRPRLQSEPFRDHVKARYAVLSAIPTSPKVDMTGPMDSIDVGGVYRAASAVGLDYGPHFRGVGEISVAGDVIEVSLVPGLGLGAEHPVAGFDPVQLDCLLHGVIPALQGSRFDREGLALLPVRIGRVEVFAPGLRICRGRIEIRRHGMQSVLVDVTAFDVTGVSVVRLTGLRLRAVRLVPPVRLNRHAFHVVARPLLPAQAETELSAQMLGAALTAAVPTDHGLDDSANLIDAATHQAIWYALNSVADDSGRYVCRRPEHTAEVALLGMLVQFGLARQGPSAEDWHIETFCTLPDATSVALTLLNERPDLIAQLSVLLRLPSALKVVLGAASGDGDLPTPEKLYGREALNEFDRAERLLPARVLAAALDTLVGHLPDTSSARIAAAEGAAHVLKMMRARHPGLTTETFTQSDLAGFDGQHDIVLFADPSPFVLEMTSDVLAARIAPGGYLMVPCFPEAPLRRAAFVTSPGTAATPVVPQRAVERLNALGYDIILRHSLPEVVGGGEVLIVRAPHGPRQGNSIAADEAATRSWPDIWTGVHGPCAENRMGSIHLLEPEESGRPILAFLASHMDDVEMNGDGLAELILSMRDVVQHAEARGQELTVILSGGAAHDGGEPAIPHRHALWAMLRTVMNERSALRIVLIDTSAVDALQDATMIGYLKRIFYDLPEETEIILTSDGVQGLRVVQGLPPVSPDSGVTNDVAWCLSKPTSARLDDLAWQPLARPAPGEGEVEIEVAATGLNYRDVMWAMGLLPEEALETGFAGPTLGLECAGRVSRTGPGVTGLVPGDPVMAFGPACFASHLITQRNWVVRLPEDVVLEAATAMPVAFFTASYALETLGQLRSSETVLIHGGAGGVGLAAIAIAQRIGSRVIATAGSPVKRRLLRALGVKHVLSSRDTSFADEVRRITDGHGVDVVLNSLAGQAMELSLALLRPFGRFLELGKQDFYTGTAVTLRPLKDNVAYFGIDIDTLLAARPDEAQKVFAQALKDFGADWHGVMPFTAFEGHDVVEAFRLMQRSGHIGKIVVRPPHGEADAALPLSETPDAFVADPGGWHVIAGGLGGLGLLTAEFLALRGARRLALLSRSGVPLPQQTDVVEQIRAAGADVRVIACDITDRAALAAVLQELRAAAPISGVYHAAMVLEDQMIGSLDAKGLARTLPVKTLGLYNLDLETRQDRPGAFVAFTSLAALIGNPGQAAYVAANAWQEALIAGRAAAGLPSLAVAWGALSDVGHAARDTALSRMLHQMSGGVAFTGAAAMQVLGRLLTRPDPGGVVTVTPMNWTAAVSALPILNSPSHAELRALAEVRGRDETQGALREDLATLSQAKAVKRAASFLQAEIAAILRVPEASLQSARPLAEYGMDSLMGVELGLAVQAALGDDLPMPSMDESFNIERLAELFVAHIKSQDSASGRDEVKLQHSSRLARLQSQHTGRVSLPEQDNFT